ncbi:alpha/beta fold hydrolase [Pseudoduganella albidiflava]|uniref:Alpha/beta fold hydrolase n=1 Tax=Pseudoduganella albidiflava TaxID=321983 RepID=A0A411WZP0_9BURK|nr:alpha/beta fold hydrolase [Pseudoduganella albidiflava]QBI02207.1 alpha/beta fold hydrolase [Pseudoduganella albidiflava]GGY59694.1 alpha/beta hydrolase [Pseudoduganella albidiflava]
MPSLAMIVATAGLAVPALAGGLALFTRQVERKVEAALPPEGIFIDVAGARLHVREQGEGPALLMIHGLGGHMAHFTYEVARQLSHHHRVITVDRPGSGYSRRRPGTAAGLREQAAALAELIDRMELEYPLVVGHSFGGAVALALALDYPERVAGLSLLAPLTHLPDDTPPAFRVLAMRSPLLRRLAAWTVATPGAIARGGAVLEQLFGPDPVPHDFSTRGGGLLGLRPGQFLAAAEDMQALAGQLPAYSSRYGELRMPVAVLFGRDDRILPWREHGEALACKVPHAVLEVVEGGHMLPIAQPDLTVQFIRAAAAR